MISSIDSKLINKESRVVTHENKQTMKKFYIIMTVIIMNILIVGFIGYHHKKKISAENQWINQLESATNELFTDSQEDIQENLSKKQINSLKVQLDKNENENEKLQSENITKYKTISKQVNQAEDILAIQDKIEALAIDEVVKEQIHSKEIKDIHYLLENYKTEYPQFYEREADHLRLYQEQIALRDEAIDSVNQLFDANHIKENVTLNDQKRAKQKVEKIADQPIKKDLENNLKQVKEEILTNGKFVALTFDDGPVL